jgi:hypothetical protein
MIAAIKTRIETVPMHDINKSLRMIGGYAWLGTGVLFVCYLYFVGSITFSVVKQQGLEQENRALISQMSREELKFLNTQKTLTVAHGESLGLVAAPTVAFAEPRGAFAWNVGR